MEYLAAPAEISRYEFAILNAAMGIIKERTLRIDRIVGDTIFDEGWEDSDFADEICASLHLGTLIQPPFMMSFHLDSKPDEKVMFPISEEEAIDKDYWTYGVGKFGFQDIVCFTEGEMTKFFEAKLPRTIDHLIVSVWRPVS